MENLFFEKPILNSPYEYPSRHWELDAQGQPTQQIIEKRRPSARVLPFGEKAIKILQDKYDREEQRCFGKKFI